MGFLDDWNRVMIGDIVGDIFGNKDAAKAGAFWDKENPLSGALWGSTLAPLFGKEDKKRNSK
jgi:hypothetical protein